MTRTSLNTFLIFIFLIGFGCDDSTRETESGVQYQVIMRADTIEKPQNGQYLLLDVLLKTASDSIIYSSEQTGILFHINYDTYRQKLMKANPLQDVFFELNKGDSVIFNVQPEDLAFIDPDAVQRLPDEAIICQARLIDILDYEAFSQWKTEQFERQQAKLRREREKRTTRQTHSIDSLLSAQDKPHEVSPSGIRYYIKRQGKGMLPAKGDSVFFTYEVSYLDGEALPGKFGKSGTDPQAMLLGAPGLPASWQESLMVLKAEGSGIFYFPSDRAFDRSKLSGIRSGSILKADIRLVRIGRQ